MNPPTAHRIHALAAFLEARWEETARAAKLAARHHSERWSCQATGIVDLGSRDLALLATGDHDVGQHIVRHDPEATLAGIASQRDALTLVLVCADRENIAPLVELLLRRMARPYRDHPDHPDRHLMGGEGTGKPAPRRCSWAAASSAAP